jgi:hypothetical protein
MRILVLPNLSRLTDVGYDSCFVVPWQWARYMPQHYFYISVPETVDTRGFELPNVKFLKCEKFVDYHTQQVMVDADLYFNFNQLNGVYPIDAISTSRVPAAIILKRMFTSNNGSSSIPSVIFTSKAMAKGDTHDADSEIERKIRSMSYTECVSTFNTQRELDISRKACSQFLMASEMARFDANARVVSVGIPHDEIEQATNGVSKNKEFTVYYGGRLTSNKRWFDVLDMYDEFLKANADARAVLSTFYNIKPLEEHRRRLGDRLSVFQDLSRQQLFKLQAEAHASICMINKGNSAGIYLEQILAGQVVLFVDRPWSRSTFDGVKQPFFFSTAEEALALLRWVKNNYDEAQSKMKPIREHIIGKLGIHTVTQQLDSILSEVTEDTYESGMPKKALFLGVFASMPKLFSLNMFCDALIDRDPIFKLSLEPNRAHLSNPLSSGWLPFGRRDVLRWLSTIATDTMDSDIATFRKDSD